MEQEISSSIFLNIDFIYYLIYLFFRTIFEFILAPLGLLSQDGISAVNFFNIFKYAGGDAGSVADGYSKFGEGIGSLYDGYSLFSPPHGLSSFSDAGGWWHNFTTNPYCESCPSFFDLFFGGLNGLLYILVMVALIFLFYLKDILQVLEKRESVIYDTVFVKDGEMETEIGNQKQEKWARIVEQMNSSSPNDWKASIIDADNMLEEILKEQGFVGDTLGEMLKTADFKSKQNAWQAHLVRNKIAHDSSYEITARDTKKAIGNFSQVFSEFYQ